MGGQQRAQSLVLFKRLHRRKQATSADALCDETMLSLDALAGLGWAGSSMQVGDRGALTSQMNLAAPLGGAHHFAQRLSDEGVTASSGFGGGRPSLEEVLMKRCQQQIAAIAAAAPAADGVEQLPFLSRNLPASTWEHPDARKLLGQDRFAHPLLSATASFESSMRNGRKRGWTTEEVPNLPSLFDEALGMEAKRMRTDGSDLSMPLAQEDSQSQLQAQAMLDDFAGAGPESSTCPHHCPRSTPAFCLTTPHPSLPCADEFFAENTNVPSPFL